MGWWPLLLPATWRSWLGCWMRAPACRVYSTRWTQPATTASCQKRSTKRCTRTAVRAAERAAHAAQKASVTAVQREDTDGNHEMQEGRARVCSVSVDRVDTGEKRHERAGTCCAEVGVSDRGWPGGLP